MQPSAIHMSGSSAIEQMQHLNHLPDGNIRSAKRPRTNLEFNRDTDPPPPPTAGGAHPTTPATENSTGKKPQGKKTQLSCAECRRLKLKCDRVFPCAACCKRGVGDICPSGSLTSGKGSRFILANTEQLHAKILQLNDRIRQLEEALETLQVSCSNEPHPLLHQDLLQIKTTLQLYGPHHNGSPPANRAPESQADEPSSRTVAKVRDNNQYDGPTARIEFLLPELDNDTVVLMDEDGSKYGIPEDIFQLSKTFPVPWIVDPNMRRRVREMLPPRQETEEICEQARQHAFWQFNPDPSETFLPNLLHHVYHASLEALCPRRLSVLLCILAIGSLVDVNQPIGSPRAEMYHHLSRAMITEIPLMDEPNFDLIHGLFFMIWYQLIFSDTKKALGYAWSMIGLTAKLAHSIGLHRDASRGKILPEELEKRRHLFWELLSLDARVSLTLGRPPSLALRHSDCKRPAYILEGARSLPDAVLYHDWKHTFFTNCLSPILESTVGVAQPPSYASVVDLDSRVRDFPIPPVLDIFYSPPLNSSRSVFMQRAHVSAGREIALLQLHRSYFTHAISGPECFTLRHKYAPSVIATYRSACCLVSIYEAMFNREPELTPRFLSFWFNAFSAAVALHMLVCRAPLASLAPSALQEIERVYRLFKRVQGVPFIQKAKPLLAKLTEKSRHIYMQWCNGPNMDEAQEMRIVAMQTSFKHVHQSLLLCLEQPSSRVAPQTHNSYASLNQSVGENPYPRGSGTHSHMNIMEMSSEAFEAASNGYSPPSKNTMTIPPAAPPRVPDNEAFNFDFGALASHMSDQSYMAWF